jgi:glucose/arabinose dehydrogenase
MRGFDWGYRRRNSKIEPSRRGEAVMRARWRRCGWPVATLVVLATLSWGGAAQAQPALVLQQIASGLASPVAVANAGDGSMRLFIVEQGGTIRIHDGAQVLATPFLDITAKVVSGGERGLLGLAFDPSYTTNGFFYVFYTSQPNGAVTIARYSVTGNANVADPNSELVLKTQAHPDGNHNGGALAFGPDGCLYAGIGDGGGAGDPDHNGQNLGTLLGKIIRINKADGTPCAAGPGNPFINTQGARPEIWALGLRNPWRITFDRATGDLLIGDVGQDTREEVDFQPAGVAGRNYCWRRKEGFLVVDANEPCTAGTPTDPVLDYDHSVGCSITGGYRYRGSLFPAVVGTYFYADFCSGRIWGATQNGGQWTTTQLLDTTLNISTFGEDEAGELYLAHLGGAVYRLVFGNALQVSPAANMAAAGPQGGPFLPASFNYLLNATSGSVNYAISIQFGAGTPSWLSASSTSGTATVSPVSVTLSVNPAANTLGPGTYAAVVNFTNTTNGQGNTTRAVTLTVSQNACTVASQLGDFNGDGRSDLLFRRTDGQLLLYELNGFQVLAANLLGAIGVDLRIVGVADFNGDGTADILVRRASDGLLFLYLMNGHQITAAQTIGVVGPDWELVGVGDVNGDGRADILFRRSGDGMLALYLMNGFQLVAAQALGTVGLEWRVRGLRDFDGDGKADILLRRTSDGMLLLYRMNGFQVVAAQSLGAIGPDWNLVGVGDVNGDGRADILFRRGDGTLSLYLMNGFQLLGAQLIGTVGTEWSLVGLGDVNGDARSDMVFRRLSDGRLSLFLMDGFQVLSAQLLGAVGTEWTGCYGQPSTGAPEVSQR